MADALTAVPDIYEGVWMNWSRGKIWGLTWTLSPTFAVIMTNGLAILVTVCGVQLFSIIRHALYATGKSSHPGLTSPHLEKQQVVLKSATSDLATAQGMLSLAWNHRRSSGKRSKRSYVIGIFALTYTVMFWLAGIFSNKAISTSSVSGPWEVLSRSKLCGTWNQTYFDVVNNVDISTEDNFNLVLQYSAKQAQDVELSLEYAQECYLPTSSVSQASATCKVLKAPNLYSSYAQGSCPFPAHLCHTNSEVIVLDTGDIDSHEDLGINASPDDRLTYRRTTTCTALNDTIYITGWNGTIANASSIRPAPATAYANFGPSLYKQTNWTYAYSNFGSYFDAFSNEVTLPYSLDSQMVFADSPDISDFEPVAELTIAEADLILFFLSYTGMYVEEVNDPWFSAHQKAEFGSSLPSYLQKRYSRDQAISTLGCTEMHNFCTSNGTCTGFGGFAQVQNVDAFTSVLTSHQNATFDRILRAVAASSLARLSEDLASTTTPLLATRATYGGSSGAVLSRGLTDNQWTLEIKYWHAIAMAHLQRTLFHWGTGQIAPTPQYVDYIEPATTEQDVWFCDNMILRSTVYQSFNLVALILIVAIGIMIIIAGFSKESLAALGRFLRKPWTRRNEHRTETPTSERSSGSRSPLHHQFRRNQARKSKLSGALKSPTINEARSVRRASSPTLGLEIRHISNIGWPFALADDEKQDANFI